jgi:hypothetical protein
VSKAFLGFVVLMVGAVLFASTAALQLGLQEVALARSGPRRALAAEELTAGGRAWVQLFGCVRHDLAVAVANGGAVYRLGAPVAGASDEDPVFTPLAAAGDCEEGTRPRRLYALVEDDEALGTTLGRVYGARVTPPPVRAFVDGVIGVPALVHGRAAAHAAQFLGADGADVRDLPLVAKGKRPAVLWVAVLTAAAGAHGYLLLAAVGLWAWRRRRRAAARDHFTEQENEFLNDSDQQ